MELKGKVSTTSRAGTYCSADVPVSEQLDGQGWDSPQAHRPHLIPSCSHCFLIVFCDSGDGSSSEMLSCRLMIPLLHFIYMDIIYTPSDNPKQPFSLPGVSAPWNSRTQFPWCSSQLLFGQPTHTVIPSSFFIILCSFFFIYFPPSCWHLASTELSRTKHVFKLRSCHYIKKWDYCLYLWEEVSAFTTPN